MRHNRVSCRRASRSRTLRPVPVRLGARAARPVGAPRADRRPTARSVSSGAWWSWPQGHGRCDRRSRIGHDWVNPRLARVAPHAVRPAERALAFGRELAFRLVVLVDVRVGQRAGGADTLQCAPGKVRVTLPTATCPLAIVRLPVWRMNVSLRPGPSTMSITAPEGSVQSTLAGRLIVFGLPIVPGLASAVP